MGLKCTDKGVVQSEERSRSMKGLIKVCSGGSAMWRGWRGIGLPIESM